LRRHLPFALFILALASLVMAFARPQAQVTVPSRQATIILAIDVSRSMCSTDIPPNRLEAAKAAAISFVENQEPTTRIGIVAFGGFAEVIQEPTNDVELLRDAIERLAPARRTAIGSGILESLNAITDIDKNIAPLATDGSTAVPSKPLPKGEYVPHIIVLLTDGVSNSGPLPTDAAQEAVIRGVRIYTIGFGSSNPGAMRNCSQFGSSGNTGEQFFQTGGFQRGIDEPTLIQVANMTGGEYYPASSAGELDEVFQNLPTYLITVKEFIEISFIFTAIGAALVALAIVLAMIWNPIS
jgi:Ca-activated chloride channel family protein